MQGLSHHSNMFSVIKNNTASKEREPLKEFCWPDAGAD